MRETAVIPIEVSKPGAMRVSVYDLLGREVGRPLDGFFTAGRHDMTGNASPLPSGVYAYRVSAAAGQRVRQVVVRR